MRHVYEMCILLHLRLIYMNNAPFLFPCFCSMGCFFFSLSLFEVPPSITDGFDSFDHFCSHSVVTKCIFSWMMAGTSVSWNCNKYPCDTYWLRCSPATAVNGDITMVPLGSNVSVQNRNSRISDLGCLDDTLCGNQFWE